jgi:predicted Zn-dependent protease
MKRQAWMAVGLAVCAAAQAQSTSTPPAKADAPSRAAVSNEVYTLMTGARERLGEDKWLEAAALFEKVRTLDPSNTDAAFGLGTAYSQLERYKEALPLLEQVLKEAPQSPVVKNNLAWIYARAKDPAIRDPARAVRLARDAVLALPADYNIWNTLAESYYAAGTYDRALRAARNAWQLSQLAGVTNDAPFREILTKCRSAAGDKDAAAAE